jgi:5-formyltetrahydrofolate cyclo-ligase
MEKDEIRVLYKQKRKALTESEINELSERIHQLVRTSLDLNGKNCSIFLPIKKQNEVNSFLIIEDIGFSNTCFAVSKSDFLSGKLNHFIYKNRGQLMENDFGIPEPTYGEVIYATQFDVVFVPLFAIDRSGHRVGYGKGFYDRFLSSCRTDCEFIGLTLFDEFVEIDNLSKYDIPLHKCISPNRIHSFEK